MTITNGYCTLAELRARAGITATLDTTDDTTMEAVIESVSRAIDNYTRRTFYARTETRLFDVPTGRELMLDDDLLTVSTLTNGDTTTVTSGDYQLLPLNTTPKYAIRLKQSSSVSWQSDTNGNDEGVISIAGTWGYTSTTPKPIHEACLIQSHRIFKRKDSPYGIAGIIDGQTVSLKKGFDPDVEMLLLPYVRQ